MKKKMTVSELEQWSRYAVQMREKASKGELEFGDYLSNVKK